MPVDLIRDTKTQGDILWDEESYIHSSDGMENPVEYTVCMLL